MEEAQETRNIKKNFAAAEKKLKDLLKNDFDQTYKANYEKILNSINSLQKSSNEEDTAQLIQILNYLVEDLDKDNHKPLNKNSQKIIEIIERLGKKAIDQFKSTKTDEKKFHKDQSKFLGAMIAGAVLFTVIIMLLLTLLTVPPYILGIILLVFLVAPELFVLIGSGAGLWFAGLCGFIKNDSPRANWSDKNYENSIKNQIQHIQQLDKVAKNINKLNPQNLSPNDDTSNKVLIHLNDNPIEKIIGNSLKDSLNAYVNRIESNKNKVGKNNYKYGFWAFKESRAFNRKINYKLAKNLAHDLERPDNIPSIFSEANISNQRSDIISKNNLNKPLGYVNLGIHSDELNEIMKIGQTILPLEKPITQNLFEV